MDFTTKLILGLIALHLVLGFGYLVYKLSPRKKEHEDVVGGCYGHASWRQQWRIRCCGARGVSATLKIELHQGSA